jgi:hypothetical protein
VIVAATPLGIAASILERLAPPSAGLVFDIGSLGTRCARAWSAAR